MADNLNPGQKEPRKSVATPVRIWLILGLTALFLLFALFAILLMATRALQTRQKSIVSPVPSAPPAVVASPSPGSSAEAPALPSPSNSPNSESSGTHSESPTAALKSPSPTPESAASASPETAPQAATPTPVPSETPSPASAESPANGTDIPAPSPASRATPPPVVANAQEEDVTRKEVLKRIDMIPELTPKEKDYLYSQVERARGFTKLAIIPYGSGQLWPDSFQSQYLLENLAKPQIAKIFEDPTVVLVLAGFSDLKGSDERNLEISRSRAENLVKLLHRKTKIANLMRAVGMGGSDIFDKMHLEKNRVVEMWIVRP